MCQTSPGRVVKNKGSHIVYVLASINVIIYRQQHLMVYMANEPRFYNSIIFKTKQQHKHLPSSVKCARCTSFYRHIILMNLHDHVNVVTGNLRIINLAGVPFVRSSSPISHKLTR